MNTLAGLFSIQARSIKGSVSPLLASLLFSLITTAVCGAQNGTLSADARRDLEVRPGVVYLRGELVGSFQGDLDGTFVKVPCTVRWSGTGFLYRPDGYLITNGHVAQWANMKDPAAGTAQRLKLRECVTGELTKRGVDHRVTEMLASYIAERMRIASQLTVFLDNGTQHYVGEIKAYSDPITSDGKDVAIVKIDGNNLPTVPLGDSNGVNVYDHVFVIGYPGDANISESSFLVATSSDGIISALKVKDQSSTPLLQTNTNINHGNSGAPAFDASGHVIGIATFGSSNAPGFNFLVPISTAMEFVRQAGAEPQRGAFDKTWREALDAYSGEDWSQAHSLLNDVLEMIPNQPEAQKLQLQAAAYERQENPLRRVKEAVGLPALVGFAAIVALTAGLLVWLLVRKPRAAAPPVPYKRVTVAPVDPANDALRIIDASPKATAAASNSFGTLHVSGGPLTGNRFPIPKAGLLIGRDPTKCTVVLADDSISKEHAWVVPLDNGVAVIDRNSSNGTFVNSVDSPRINKVVLRHGDRVYLGKLNGTVFTYFSA
jgi:S1-C subfamily serine protease